MLQDTDKIRVENRSTSIVGFKAPDANYRRFVANEVKEIPMGELRNAVQVPGTYRTIMNNLIIHDKTAVEELLPNAEPEYFYTAKDVDFLLTRGTLDQLKDALDFAPEGVVTLIKEQAVKTELNDVRKRDAILNQTNFDVNKAIELKHLSEAPEEVETKTRRTSILAEDVASAEAPIRRTAAPKYTVIK